MSLKGIFGTDSVDNDRPSADHAFHVSQLHIILNKIDTLLETFASKVRDGLYNATSPE
jgi:nuclear pore complex protein Nup107